MEDLLNACISQLDPKALPYEISVFDKEQTVLDRFRPNGKTYELLLSKANADRSDVTFRKLKSVNRRKAGKAVDEGVEISSYVIVRPNTTNPYTATVLMTMGAGVSVRDVTKLLGQLANKAAGDSRFKKCFWFDHPSAAKKEDGTSEQYKVRYRFEHECYLGQTLSEALTHGKFQDMELIAEGPIKMDDGSGNFQAVKKTVTVKAHTPQLVTAASLKNFVKSLAGKKALADGDEFQTLRVHYESDDGRDATATLAINDLERSFTKKAKIELDGEVEEYQSDFHRAIVQPLRELLKVVPS
ncbi:hypothetical protein CLI92_05875 [Vandammella animalimorsus]|uniref:Uncharacterized protein n=2 Tax=Vandammella animalimorsus TaxID=2029117 RepID=A0A2A2T5Z8_9BURK|nr:hypothetical protein CLI92_05875 [Vandammella animalimorsus]PAX19046.1 hypothetical protein CLI93_09805 [Vandammella animalimorsus]